MAKTDDPLAEVEAAWWKCSRFGRPDDEPCQYHGDKDALHYDTRLLAEPAVRKVMVKRWRQFVKNQRLVASRYKENGNMDGMVAADCAADRAEREADRLERGGGGGK